MQRLSAFLLFFADKKLLLKALLTFIPPLLVQNRGKDTP